MKSVRTKLLALVLACVAPALVAVVLRARAAEHELIGLVRARVDVADDAFIDEVGEDQGQAAVAAKLASARPRMIAALSGEPGKSAEEVLRSLAGVYAGSITALVDRDRKVVAASGPALEPGTVLSSPGLAPLREGNDVSGLIPVDWLGPGRFALVSGTAVRKADSTILGAVLVLTPLDDAYLDRIDKMTGSRYVVRVDNKRAAISPGATVDARIHSTAEQVVELVAIDGRYFAVNTFHTPALGYLGHSVEITAWQDVTALRGQVRTQLAISLAIILGGMLLVIPLALWNAGRIGTAVERITAAAGEVSRGNYVDVVPVRTHDELETLALAFNRMVNGLKQRDRLKSSFGRYVSPEIVRRILEGEEVLNQTVPVTVLFSDIRGFTTLSEGMEPKAVLELLNTYFAGMVESVVTHNGRVDKFMGDAIMAVYGAPLPNVDHPLDAVKSALDMNRRLEGINAEFRKKGMPELRTGIGIHSGSVVAGHMGDQENKMEYTVIGDTVNVASRLESMTKEMKVKILISEDTFLAVKEHVEAEPLEQIRT